jgi:hypothetical protein
MTSREHARRLMLILLSSQPGSAGADAADAREGEAAEDCQATDGRDDSTDGDERRTNRLVDPLLLT